jgi:hypothetical protein
MPFDCPKAPFVGSPLALKTTVLPAGKTLVRFHGITNPANSFNPNTGADWLKPLDGARFNPFPDLNSTNVPTVYAADSFTAAALDASYATDAFKVAEEIPVKQLSGFERGHTVPNQVAGFAERLTPSKLSTASRRVL